MFCDMKGFTPLSERLGPDTMYDVMDQVYEILMRQVHDFGGTVNEMTGDGIMALFGAPVALEEAPQRAIRASLSIHREMASLTDRLRKTKDDLPPIQMRIGIHTGPVVVGSLGDDLRVEFKAVGDTVVLAARLEQIAQPGSTYVSRDVFRVTEGYFHFETLEPTMVKGKAEPVQVYRVTGIKEKQERSVGIGSPLVGREKGLNLLELQILRLINGTGGIVTVTGEAGIGKSRLMAELHRTEAVKKTMLLEGRALSIGRSLSFYPIIDALKHWSQIREEDTDTDAQRKLEKTIRAIHPEEVNMDQARDRFEYLETIRGETPLAPFYLSDYLVGRFMFALQTLENALKTGDASCDKCAQEARLWGKKSLKGSKKFKRERVEAIRSMGTFHWLTGKKRDALKWWRLSIVTGEAFNMKPELSRTYFEIGKRLSEPNSPYQELNGISAAEYLNKARALFEEMDLQWDLEQLENLS
jgi:class 3 adenylate cyclase